MGKKEKWFEKQALSNYPQPLRKQVHVNLQ